MVCFSERDNRSLVERSLTDSVLETYTYGWPLRMVYVNFHKSICLRDFPGKGGVGGGGGGGISFVAELLRDGLEFPNAILQDSYR